MSEKRHAYLAWDQSDGTGMTYEDECAFLDANPPDTNLSWDDPAFEPYGVFGKSLMMQYERIVGTIPARLLEIAAAAAEAQEPGLKPHTAHLAEACQYMAKGSLRGYLIDILWEMNDFADTLSLPGFKSSISAEDELQLNRNSYSALVDRVLSINALLVKPDPIPVQIKLLYPQIAAKYEKQPEGASL